MVFLLQQINYRQMGKISFVFELLGFIYTEIRTKICNPKEFKDTLNFWTRLLLILYNYNSNSGI